MNEPNFAAMGGEPAGYDAAAYGRDSKVFHAFVKRVAPRLVILGPGSVGERAAGGLGSLSSRMIEGETLLVAAGSGGGRVLLSSLRDGLSALRARAGR
jgi:hypothetical protein